MSERSVYATQGGGLAKETGNSGVFRFTEVTKELREMGLNVGDVVPSEWDMVRLRKSPEGTLTTPTVADDIEDYRSSDSL